MDVLEFKDQLVDLMRDVSVNIDNAFLPIVHKYDLTLIQAQILKHINDDQNHSIGSLAKIMNIQSGNTSSMCKQLEKKGYLERHRDMSDERVVKIQLTDKGISTIAEIDNILKQIYTPIFSSENHDDIQTIILGLQNLKDLLIRMNKV
ncbi:MarR family transcriptional regulator [Tissierella pigra]|uniref:HTH-type transcriptional regulator SarZ n=1 Tax=Tissierella pigra TaxID=2607614 RepID=A0A6N7Y1M9_9FIRM|nr:MarR family transcriptional regulator [Tissierella pigra]MBU5426317.1 MarR family transcriptional regulator [Tissierella pigra]MSU02734.1 MarR family transcriptional regulator [Tissierella pigra]